MVVFLIIIIRFGLFFGVNSPFTLVVYDNAAMLFRSTKHDPTYHLRGGHFIMTELLFLREPII